MSTPILTGPYIFPFNYKINIINELVNRPLPCAYFYKGTKPNWNKLHKAESSEAKTVPLIVKKFPALYELGISSPCSQQTPPPHTHTHTRVLNRISLVHAFPSYFFKINFNIIRPSTSRCSKLASFFKLPPPHTCTDFPSPRYVPHASWLISSIQ
jgi:hypothetical protein